ncbi:hypothetical protein LguiB_020540 [Lonicera macranthoides]
MAGDWGNDGQKSPKSHRGTTTNHTRLIFRSAIASRLPVIALIILWRNFLSPYDTSASLNPNNCTSSSSSSNGSSSHGTNIRFPHISSAIEESIVWDGVYFVQTAECEGYEYEQSYAFLPLLPISISFLSTTVPAPLIPLISHRAVLGLSGYVLNNVAFLFAAVYFYRSKINKNLQPQSKIMRKEKHMANHQQRHKLNLDKRLSYGPSYAEIVQRKLKSQSRKDVESFLDNHAFTENRIMVCLREKVEDSWMSIQRTMNKFFKTNIQLKPFQADKALFVCSSEEELQKFASMNFAFLEGPLVIRFRRWDEEDCYRESKITCTGGWISVSGLPLNMWKTEVFKKIADCCGGLLEIHPSTVNRSSLFEAKIKVKGYVSGFIPAGVSIKGENSSYALRFKNLSKLELGFRRFFKSGPLSAMDFAFLGFCGEDEDVEYEELPGHVRQKDTETNIETTVPRMEMTLQEVSNAEESHEKLLNRDGAREISIKKVFNNLKNCLGTEEEEPRFGIEDQRSAERDGPNLDKSTKKGESEGSKKFRT